jgi:hypothetical protein
VYFFPKKVASINDATYLHDVAPVVYKRFTTLVSTNSTREQQFADTGVTAGVVGKLSDSGIIIIRFTRSGVHDFQGSDGLCWQN